MSFYPEWKCCLKCGRRYPYNPDTGQLACPSCCLTGSRNLLWSLARLIMEDSGK